MDLKKAFQNSLLFGRFLSPSGRLPAFFLRLAAHRSPLTAKSGIALILVLGALSLMMLLAVSFAISMRTERLAAGNYADTVRTRQLAQVGLVRAMNDICRLMGTNLNAVGAQVYPPWAVTNASGGTAVSNEYARLMTGAMTNFIPRVLFTDAKTMANRWVDIWASNVASVTVIGITNITTNYDVALMGRVGYLILNCSGLLDANCAGGVGIARQYGTNPAEIALTNLPEIGAATNNLVNKRVTDIRYESVEELHEFSVSSHPSNFCVYSYFPAGYWDAAAGMIRSQVNLAGTAEELELRTLAIRDGFIKAGFDSAQADILVENLIDYIDTNSVPHGWTSYVESVPMINEMGFSNTVTYIPGSPDTWQVNCGVTFELWYPFVSGGGVYSFTASVDFVSTPPAVGTLTVGGRRDNILLSSTQTFEVVSFVGSHISSVDPGMFTFSVQMNNAAQVVNGEGTLDELDTGEVLSGMAQNSRICRECLDPRFNKNWADPNQWRAATNSTFRVINAWTTNYLAANYNGDMDAKMYVANAPLHSVGELGYLVYSSNKPWCTVKLYGTNLHRVLDVFAIGVNDTDVVVTHSRRGLVNPNSDDIKASAALAAIFAGMPVDNYPDPGDPAAIPLPMADARTLSTRFWDSGVICTNLSDFGRGLTNFSSLGAVTFDNELKNESLFRNAGGLLSVRQNVFMIVIEAQLAYAGIFPRYMNMAHQRAVAVVWRDPYTGEFLVRSFQWLED